MRTLEFAKVRWRTPLRIVEMVLSVMLFVVLGTSHCSPLGPSNSQSHGGAGLRIVRSLSRLSSGPLFIIPDSSGFITEGIAPSTASNFGVANPNRGKSISSAFAEFDNSGPTSNGQGLGATTNSIGVKIPSFSSLDNGHSSTRQTQNRNIGIFIPDRPAPFTSLPPNSFKIENRVGGQNGRVGGFGIQLPGNRRSSSAVISPSIDRAQENNGATFTTGIPLPNGFMRRQPPSTGFSNQESLGTGTILPMTRSAPMFPTGFGVPIPTVATNNARSSPLNVGVSLSSQAGKVNPRLRSGGDISVNEGRLFTRAEDFEDVILHISNSRLQRNGAGVSLPFSNVGSSRTEGSSLPNSLRHGIPLPTINGGAPNVPTVRSGVTELSSNIQSGISLPTFNRGAKTGRAGVSLPSFMEDSTRSRIPSEQSNSRTGIPLPTFNRATQNERTSSPVTGRSGVQLPSFRGGSTRAEVASVPDSIRSGIPLPTFSRGTQKEIAPVTKAGTLGISLPSFNAASTIPGFPSLPSNARAGIPLPSFNRATQNERTLSPVTGRSGVQLPPFRDGSTRAEVASVADSIRSGIPLPTFSRGTQKEIAPVTKAETLGISLPSFNVASTIPGIPSLPSNARAGIPLPSFNRATQNERTLSPVTGRSGVTLPFFTGGSPRAEVASVTDSIGSGIPLPPFNRATQNGQNDISATARHGIPLPVFNRGFQRNENPVLRVDQFSPIDGPLFVVNEDFEDSGQFKSPIGNNEGTMRSGIPLPGGHRSSVSLQDAGTPFSAHERVNEEQLFITVDDDFDEQTVVLNIPQNNFGIPHPRDRGGRTGILGQTNLNILIDDDDNDDYDDLFSRETFDESDEVISLGRRFHPSGIPRRMDPIPISSQTNTLKPPGNSRITNPFIFHPALLADSDEIEDDDDDDDNDDDDIVVRVSHVADLHNPDRHNERLSLTDNLMNQYNFVDVQGTSKWGYKTNDQFQDHSLRSDGTMEGNFGWSSPEGSKVKVQYVADKGGYRVVSSSGLYTKDDEAVTSAKKQHLLEHERVRSRFQEEKSKIAVRKESASGVGVSIPIVQDKVVDRTSTSNQQIGGSSSFGVPLPTLSVTTQEKKSGISIPEQPPTTRGSSPTAGVGVPLPFPIGRKDEIVIDVEPEIAQPVIKNEIQGLRPDLSTLSVGVGLPATSVRESSQPTSSQGSLGVTLPALSKGGKSEHVESGVNANIGAGVPLPSLNVADISLNADKPHGFSGISIPARIDGKHSANPIPTSGANIGVGLPSLTRQSPDAPSTDGVATVPAKDERTGRIGIELPSRHLKQSGVSIPRTDKIVIKESIAPSNQPHRFGIATPPLKSIGQGAPEAPISDIGVSFPNPAEEIISVGVPISSQGDGILLPTGKIHQVPSAAKANIGVGLPAPTRKSALPESSGKPFNLREKVAISTQGIRIPIPESPRSIPKTNQIIIKESISPNDKPHSFGESAPRTPVSDIGISLPNPVKKTTFIKSKDQVIANEGLPISSQGFPARKPILPEPSKKPLNVREKVVISSHGSGIPIPASPQLKDQVIVNEGLPISSQRFPARKPILPEPSKKPLNVREKVVISSHGSGIPIPASPQLKDQVIVNEGLPISSQFSGISLPAREVPEAPSAGRTNLGVALPATIRKSALPEISGKPLNVREKVAAISLGSGIPKPVSPKSPPSKIARAENPKTNIGVPLTTTRVVKGSNKVVLTREGIAGRAGIPMPTLTGMQVGPVRNIQTVQTGEPPLLVSRGQTAVGVSLPSIVKESAAVRSQAQPKVRDNVIIGDKDTTQVRFRSNVGVPFPSRRLNLFANIPQSSKSSIVDSNNRGVNRHINRQHLGVNAQGLNAGVSLPSVGRGQNDVQQSLPLDGVSDTFLRILEDSERNRINGQAEKKMPFFESGPPEIASGGPTKPTGSKKLIEEIVLKTEVDEVLIPKSEIPKVDVALTKIIPDKATASPAFLDPCLIGTIHPALLPPECLNKEQNNEHNPIDVEEEEIENINPEPELTTAVRNTISETNVQPDSLGPHKPVLVKDSTIELEPLTLNVVDISSGTVKKETKKEIPSVVDVIVLENMNDHGIIGEKQGENFIDRNAETVLKVKPKINSEEPMELIVVATPEKSNEKTNRALDKSSSLQENSKPDASAPNKVAQDTIVLNVNENIVENNVN